MGTDMLRHYEGGQILNSTQQGNPTNDFRNPPVHGTVKQQLRISTGARKTFEAKPITDLGMKLKRAML